MLDSDMLYSLVPRPRVTAAAGGLHLGTRLTDGAVRLYG